MWSSGRYQDHFPDTKISINSRGVGRLRKVGAKELCVLCAQRSAEADKALRDATADHKLHGGYGWLWKHIAWVIGCFVGYLYLRGIISSFVRSLFGGA
jgi:hypothetical protein